jgi:hypothetical protein
MNYRECVNCGAENELLVSSCAYCGSSIVREEFVEQESDELEGLIQNCGLWIARFEGMVSDVNTLRNAKQMDSMRATPIFGSIFSKTLGSNTFSYSETLGNIYQFLDLLEVKSSNSSTLREHVSLFKKRLERARGQERKTKKKQVKIIVALVGALILFIAFCLLMASLGY